MIDAIAQSLKSHLEGLELEGKKLFNKVDTTVHGRVLKQPPSAVTWMERLKPDSGISDDMLDLHWHILLCLPNLSKNYSPYATINTVREAVHKWRGFDRSVHPAKIVDITFQGFEATSILFLVRFTTLVNPETFPTGD